MNQLIPQSFLVGRGCADFSTRMVIFNPKVWQHFWGRGSLPGPEHEGWVHVDGSHATDMANFFGNHPQLLKVHQAVHFRVVS